jgi:hypothetical protein
MQRADDVTVAVEEGVPVPVGRVHELVRHHRVEDPHAVGAAPLPDDPREIGGRVEPADRRRLARVTQHPGLRVQADEVEAVVGLRVDVRQHRGEDHLADMRRMDGGVARGGEASVGDPVDDHLVDAERLAERLVVRDGLLGAVQAFAVAEDVGALLDRRGGRRGDEHS